MMEQAPRAQGGEEFLELQGLRLTHLHTCSASAPCSRSCLPFTILPALLPTGSCQLGRQDTPIRRKVNRHTPPMGETRRCSCWPGASFRFGFKVSGGVARCWFTAEATEGIWGLERAAHAPVRDSRPMVAYGTTGPRDLT